MSNSKAFGFLLDVGKALLPLLAKGIELAVPGAGLVIELGGLGIDLYQRTGKSKQDSQLLKQLAELAQLPGEEYRKWTENVLTQLCAGQPAEVRKHMRNYFAMVPSKIRRQLRSPADYSGTTIPPGMILGGAKGLARFLPDRLPNMTVGQQVPGTDLILEEFIGMGGFGEVWKARYKNRPRVCAVKFCTSEEHARALEQELKIHDHLFEQLQGAESENIVRLLGSHLSNKPPCLEYEYVEGGDLGEFIRGQHQHSKTPEEIIRRINRVMLRIVRAVAVAHECNVVHCDLKPDNILLSQKKNSVVPKIADFGIGRIAARRQASQYKTRIVSQEGPRGCTVLYASPELLKGNKPTPRDDVYALGVIWYQALYGDPEAPVSGGWRNALQEKEVPDAMIDLVESCFKVNPGDRPRDARELAQRMERVMVAPTTKEEPEAEPADSTGEIQIPQWAYVAGGVVVLLLIVFGIGVAAIVSNVSRPVAVASSPGAVTPGTSVGPISQPVPQPPSKISPVDPKLPPQQPLPTPVQKLPQPALTDTVDDVEFAIREVKWSGSNLQVWFTCKSLEKDRVFRPSFVRAPPLTDEQGTTYTQGRWLSTFPIANVMSRLPTGVPIRHGIEYSKVRRSVKTMLVMEMRTYLDEGGNKDHTVRFGNIPVPYKGD